MKTNFYFFKVDMTYVPKNRLHEEFQDFIKKNDRALLIGLRTKNKFIQEIKNKLKELNKKHYRCKPVELDSYTGMNDSTRIGIRVSGNFTADIHLADRALSSTVKNDIPEHRLQKCESCQEESIESN